MTVKYPSSLKEKHRENNNTASQLIVDQKLDALTQNSKKGMADQSQASGRDPKIMQRNLHPKSHGLVTAEFTVEDNFDPALKVGIFATSKTYQAQIRFSNGSHKVQPDKVGDPRGMAIKLLGVEGDPVMQVPNHENEQDFVLLNHPVMFLKTVQSYFDMGEVIPALRKVGDKPEDLPIELQPKYQKLAEEGFFRIMDKIKKKKIKNLLETDYWSTTPYKLGSNVMKYAVVHKYNPGLGPNNLKDEADENYLRTVMKKHLSCQDAYFDFMVQLQSDPSTMPIEDPTIEWKSELIKVATIRIPQQNFDTPERNQYDEQQSFSPWYCLKEHEPLGEVNLGRKMYAKLAQHRNQKNQTHS